MKVKSLEQSILLVKEKGNINIKLVEMTSIVLKPIVLKKPGKNMAESDEVPMMLFKRSTDKLVIFVVKKEKEM